MGIAARFRRWDHTHVTFLLLVARILLGLTLLFKGIFFISHAQQLRDLILSSRFAAGVGFWAGYITFAHLLGGVLIIIGLLTRVAAALQLPVLIGAIFFVLPQRGLADPGTGIVLTLAVFGLALLLLIKGPGEMSMDQYLKEHLL